MQSRFSILMLILALSACGQGNSGDSEVVKQGAELFASNSCNLCHGDDARGSDGGPSLSGLAEHYTVEDLMEYLKDPDAVLENSARLSKRAEEFDALMPSYEHLDDADRRKLATFVLSLE